MSYVIIDTDLAGTDALLGVVHDGALAEVIKGELRRREGNAGYIWHDGLPRLSAGSDAWLLSLDNRLE